MIRKCINFNQTSTVVKRAKSKGKVILAVIAAVLSIITVAQTEVLAHSLKQSVQSAIVELESACYIKHFIFNKVVENIITYTKLVNNSCLRNKYIKKLKDLDELNIKSDNLAKSTIRRNAKSALFDKFFYSGKKLSIARRELL